MRREAIERLLPAAYQRAAANGGALTALLDVMEHLHRPAEAVLSTVDDLFAPYRAPDALVPYLVGWVAQDRVAPARRSAADAPSDIPLGRLRDLVAEGAALAQWRGTARGLVRLLEIVTGVRGFAVVEVPDRPFHVVVRIPGAGADQERLVRRIVELEKPAAVTCDVLVEPAPDGKEQ